VQKAAAFEPENSGEWKFRLLPDTDDNIFGESVINIKLACRPPGCQRVLVQIIETAHIELLYVSKVFTASVSDPPSKDDEQTFFRWA
jgi:hypothetical protein